MGSEWQQFCLADAGSIVTGKTPRGGIPEFEGSDVPFVTPPDFNGSMWIERANRSISELGAQSVKGSIIPRCSVLVTCIGSDMGKAALTASRCVTNQQINAVLVDETKFCPEFIYYNLSLRKDEIRGLAGGSAQPILNKSAFSQIRFWAPPLSEQRTIATALRPINDRIALLRETNATLEAIAQALFKSWFVDFEPVHARARGEQPAGLAPEVAALFPDSLEESELGQVPMGWSTGSLNDLALLNPESWTVKNRPDSVAYVDLANAKENVIAEITEFLFEDAPSRARRVLRDGDTIVGTVRPGNRSYALISNPRPNLTGSTGFAVLRPKQKAATEYVYLAATANSSIEYLAHVADGGAYPAVRPEVVSNLPCVLPSYDVLNAFHAVAAPLFAKVAANHQQAQTLATLRDTLLPRLISGQLRLPDAEEQLSEAGLCQ